MEIELVVVGIRNEHTEDLKAFFLRHRVGSALYLRRVPEGQDFCGAIQVIDGKLNPVGYIGKDMRRYIENDVKKYGIVEVKIVKQLKDDKAVLVKAEKTEPDAPPFISHIDVEPDELVFGTTVSDKKLSEMSDLLLYRVKRLWEDNVTEDELGSLRKLLEEYSLICCSSLDGDTTFKRADILFILKNSLDRYPQFNDVYRSMFEDRKDLGHKNNVMKIRIYREQYEKIRNWATKARTGNGMSQIDEYWQNLLFVNGGKVDAGIIEEEMKHLAKLLVVSLNGKYIACSQSDEDFATSVYALNYDLRSLYVLYTRRIKYDFLKEKLSRLTGADDHPAESPVAVVNVEKQPRELCVHVDPKQLGILGKAEDAGIIKYNAERKGYDPGRRVSKSLVAYLCGRIFCGDYTSKKGVWKEGGRFDDAGLCKDLFGFDVAATRRSSRSTGAGKPPVGYEKIDGFFEKNK